jgi:hypothetical protein
LVEQTVVVAETPAVVAEDSAGASAVRVVVVVPVMAQETVDVVVDGSVGD